MTTHYIGLDTHCAFTEMAVVTNSGRVTRRERLKTAIPELVEAITSVRQPRRLTFEEGPLAGWLYRNLKLHVDELIVCDPRRNHLVAKDSDKDDAIDAAKLAQLLRGGYLKPVHQADSLQRAIFKEHVALYHDRVARRVGEANRAMARLRRHGIFVKEVEFSTEEKREDLLARLPGRLLRKDMSLLWRSYDAIASQANDLRADIRCRGRRIDVVKRFEAVPGMGPIRAATFYVYIDTPWRFRTKSALYRYVGIGLERRHSGTGPTQWRVARQANKHLKNVIIGAAKSAIAQRENHFADQYQKGIERGMTARNARRTVARQQASVLWGMWKSDTEYRPELLTGEC